MKNTLTNKKEILGQYFTKIDVIRKLFKLLREFVNLDLDSKILEPSFGSGNFIKVLNENNFFKVDKYEIDSNLSENPIDFFYVTLSTKYDLIIGNPPFSKYNLPPSFYYPKNYIKSLVKPWDYLPDQEAKKEKIKIENAFLYKSIKHLNSNSSIAYVLPISFFIKNKNLMLKKFLRKNFKSIIIYQNTDNWFDYNIPCCFVIFTNNETLENKILIMYEDTELYKYEIDIDKIEEEIIPQVFHNKKKSVLVGNSLHNYLENSKAKIKKSFDFNTISAKNIIEKSRVIDSNYVQNYKLAIVRVGNSSVGKSGLINFEKEILNDMFYTFDFKSEYNYDIEFKERLCNYLNENQDYFKNLSIRVGSKSIKKEDILNFKIPF